MNESLINFTTEELIDRKHQLAALDKYADFKGIWAPNFSDDIFDAWAIMRHELGNRSDISITTKNSETEVERIFYQFCDNSDAEKLIYVYETSVTA